VEFAFIVSIQPELGGRVVLRGHYSFTLQWTPETLAARRSQSADDGFSSDSSGPSLFTALREQLDLRFEATKEPLDTIVVEHVERPSEN
jgi:uncharacterized protein (TIGR03435 family)